jgi:hypothetical protein
MYKVLAVLLILLLIGIWGSIINGCVECHSRGGTYAKTMMGTYRCFEPYE